MNPGGLSLEEVTKMEKKVVAVYDGDTKRTHRFLITGGQGVLGSIYIPRNEDIPDRLIVDLETRADDKPSEG